MHVILKLGGDFLPRLGEAENPLSDWLMRARGRFLISTLKDL